MMQYCSASEVDLNGLGLPHVRAGCCLIKSALGDSLECQAKGALATYVTAQQQHA